MTSKSTCICRQLGRRPCNTGWRAWRHSPARRCSNCSAGWRRFANCPECRSSSHCSAVLPTRSIGPTASPYCCPAAYLPSGPSCPSAPCSEWYEKSSHAGPYQASAQDHTQCTHEKAKSLPVFFMSRRTDIGIHALSCILWS